MESRGLKLTSLQKVCCATGLLLPRKQSAAALFIRWLSILGCFGPEKTQTRPHKGCRALTGQAASIALQITATRAGKVGKQGGWKRIWHLTHLQWVTEPTGSGIINYSVLLNILFIAIYNKLHSVLRLRISFLSRSAERDFDRSSNLFSCPGQDQLYLKPCWHMSH